MKYIVVCGATAAGKDSVIDEMVKEANQENPGSLDKTWYYTTRKEVRPGEDPKAEYFISEEEFDRKISQGEFFSYAPNANYRVATPYSQLEKGNNIVISIPPRYVERLKEYAAQKNREVLTILLSAPRQERVQRIRMRESWLFTEPAEDKVDQDVSREGTEAGIEFDLKIENKEGRFEETMTEIMPRVKEFLNR